MERGGGGGRGGGEGRGERIAEGGRKSFVILNSRCLRRIRNDNLIQHRGQSVYKRDRGWQGSR